MVLIGYVHHSVKWLICYVVGVTKWQEKWINVTGIKGWGTLKLICVDSSGQSIRPSIRRLRKVILTSSLLLA